MKVLIVEDEARLAQALGQILKQEKYVAEMAFSGEDGLECAKSGNFDVIILDVMLPGLSGYEVAKRLRAQRVTTPILMLTAKDEVPDKVKGLDCGADDYMTKPFSPEELLARLRALTRRPGEIVQDELAHCDIRLNLSSGTLYCDEKSVRLSHKEFEILKILMAAKESITSKEMLIVKVWGYDSDAEDNNVEAYISFIRKKLSYLGSRVGVTSVRRMGYRLEEQNA